MVLDPELLPKMALDEAIKRYQSSPRITSLGSLEMSKASVSFNFSLKELPKEYFIYPNLFGKEGFPVDL